jgi:cyclic beta-1,2-glucan synthetase
MTAKPHELNNGRYKVLITHAGGGQSCLDWIALNRWPGDAVEDAHGFFIYLRDADSGELWSATLQPMGGDLANVSTKATPTAVEFARHLHGIRSMLKVSVQTDCDAEHRKLIVRNESDRPRTIEITSYIEVALAHPMGDLGHPAFSKLFVQTEFAKHRHALVAKRRPRSAGESWPAMFHALIGAEVEACETDRVRFIGRGRSAARPAMRMENTVGNVLDPVFSLRTTVQLKPGEERAITFMLGAVADHAQVDAVPANLGVPLAEAPLLPIKGEPSATLFEHGFNEDYSEYRMRLPWQGDQLALPPMPWINVLANDHFGCLISETGAGCTWSRNSQANRLTPWSNDPVSDPHGEALYLRDEVTREFWSPLPGPCPANATYEVAHGFGYSRYEVTAHGLRHETTVFVPHWDAVKIARIRITNTTEQARRLTLFSYHRLVLGSLPERGAVDAWVNDRGVLFAKRRAPNEFSRGVAFAFGVFAGAELTERYSTTSRLCFLGARGRVWSPEAVSQPHLESSPASDDDPCFAWEQGFTLAPGEMLDACVVLGEGLNQEHAESLAGEYSVLRFADEAFTHITTFLRKSLRRVHVRTPVPEIDAMVNGWLGYQTLICRIWGRTAFYQSSGAYGFRDQLQDASNLMLLWPGQAHAQVRLHAQHQFVEGDVLHWWHDKPIERGVRTRFADDLLWLPFVACQYTRSTGVERLWDEEFAFLQAPLLKPGEDENYLKPEVSDESGTIYEHCCRAIDRSMGVGAHGLPLMGTGDWNDGMNRVGREGRGESVWMGFFLFAILGEFIPVAEQREDIERVRRYTTHREQLRLALNEAGWDGEWYRRAYFDNGHPLGTKDASECRIDGLAQAWAALSEAAPLDRATKAMTSAERHLIHDEDGLLRLLTPPFVAMEDDPGYIKGYVAGVRENGGQYTHASCWMVAAAAKLGWRDKAAKWLTMLSPMAHAKRDLDRYKVEPYVIAADVYGAEPHVGRGGWTWYTGSAGWAFRVAVESVLGLRIERGKMLILKPCVPDDWPEYRIDYTSQDEVVFHIHVVNPSGCAATVLSATLDGVAVEVVDGEARVPIPDEYGAEHQIEVVLGKA